MRPAAATALPPAARVLPDLRRQPAGSGRARTLGEATKGDEMSTTAVRKILVCYDGSAEAECALERAAEIATVVPSRVTVVSVAEPSTCSSSSPPPP